jgi:hypothetical protein
LITKVFAAMISALPGEIVTLTLYPFVPRTVKVAVAACGARVRENVVPALRCGAAALAVGGTAAMLNGMQRRLSQSQDVDLSPIWAV